MKPNGRKARKLARMRKNNWNQKVLKAWMFEQKLIYGWAVIFNKAWKIIEDHSSEKYHEFSKGDKLD